MDFSNTVLTARLALRGRYPSGGVCSCRSARAFAMLMSGYGLAILGRGCRILRIFTMLAGGCALALTGQAGTSPQAAQDAYDKALAAGWQVVFEDSGRQDWREKWFADGFKATLQNTDEGMFYSAGPIAGDHASHAVLWTRDSFEGDLKIEFDYTRIDTIDQYVNLIYLYATGTGSGPYAEDISSWTHLRQIPYMRTYFDNMHLLHISFAAFANDPAAGEDSAYVRARRYPRSLFGGKFQEMALEPDYTARGLFRPGVPHRVTVLRKGSDLFMHVANASEARLFHWDLSQKPDLNRGRIGLRHMAQRAALYGNMTVSTLAEEGTETAGTAQ